MAELIEAARSGNIVGVVWWLSKHADPNSTCYGCTALTEAARNGHVSVVVKLLDAGASVDLANKDGDLPLTLASQHGHLNVLDKLLDAGANFFQVPNDDGHVALLKAVEQRRWAIVTKLADAGARVNAAATKTGSQETALHAAARAGHTAVVERLLNADADVNQTDAQGETALIKALEGRRWDVVVRLIDAGATVTPTPIGSSGTAKQQQRELIPLAIAARHGHVGVVELLLGAGAPVTYADRQGNTALHVASAEGHFLVVQALLKAGAEASFTNQDKKTAWNVATTPKIKQLLAAHQ